MILYAFYKFAAFDSSVHVCFSLRPLELPFLLTEGPWRMHKIEQGKGAAFSGEGLAGGEGQVGEE